MFVETVPGLTRDASPERLGGSARPKRKKIIVIKKKRMRDGSVKSSRQEFYKDYGIEFAHSEAVQQSRRL